MNTVILESFLTVVKYKSFTQASQVLKVTQPTISNHIAALEQLYGVDLFQREGKNAALTAAGRAFVPVAERLLAAHKDSIEEMAVYKAQSPVLRLGFTAQSVMLKLARLMPKFRERFPEQKIQHLTHFSLDELTRAIKAKEIDFGFINADTQPVYTKRIRLWEERLYFIVSVDLYKKHNESHNIYEYPFIGYTDRMVDMKVLDLKVDFTKLNTIVESNDSLTILHAVANGVGVALVPGNRKELYAKIHPDVITLGGPELVGRGIYSVIYDSEMDMNPAKQYLLELLQDAKELD